MGCARRAAGRAHRRRLVHLQPAGRSGRRLRRGGRRRAEQHAHAERGWAGGYEPMEPEFWTGRILYGCVFVLFALTNLMHFRMRVSDVHAGGIPAAPLAVAVTMVAILGGVAVIVAGLLLPDRVRASVHGHVCRQSLESVAAS